MKDRAQFVGGGDALANVTVQHGACPIDQIRTNGGLGRVLEHVTAQLGGFGLEVLAAVGLNPRFSLGHDLGGGGGGGIMGMGQG